MNDDDDADDDVVINIIINVAQTRDRRSGVMFKDNRR